MQIAPTPDYDTIAALDQLKRSIRMAFCGVMQSTQLPPMAALSLAATAVGLLYTEVAAAHRGDDSCPATRPTSKRCKLRSLATKPARVDFRQPRSKATLDVVFPVDMQRLLAQVVDRTASLAFSKGNLL
jgi:hypothetical protein